MSAGSSSTAARPRRPVAIVLLVAAVAVSMTTPGWAAEPAAAPPAHGAAPREAVLGIGGFFFKSRDPKALAAWYEAHLGVTLTPKEYGGTVWRQEAGPTVFQPFPASTDYFGAADRQWMLNFRVANLEAIVRQLSADGIAVKVDSTVYPNGRFAHLSDPEGNPLELWEPARAGAATENPSPPPDASK